MSRALLMATLLLPVMAVAAAAPVRPAAEVRGAWSTVEYRLADGTVHPLSGTIFFAQGRWQVLFFVLDGDGVPHRGSAEGGTYTVDGDALVFRHEHNLSAGAPMEALPASPLRMTVRPPAAAQAEPTRFEIDGDSLTIYFPSGNSMRFERV